MSRFELALSGSSKIVDLEAIYDPKTKIESYLCKVDGETKTLCILKRDGNFLIISIDHKVYSIRETKRTFQDMQFLVNGRLVAFKIAKSLSGEKNTGSGMASMKEVITSNFPAKVIALKVSKGSPLKEGEILLILEAMKMEAQIKAPRDCSVAEIFVHEGQMVSKGAKLALLKFT